MIYDKEWNEWYLWQTDYFKQFGFKQTIFCIDGIYSIFIERAK